MQHIHVGRFDLYPAERVLCAAGKPIELRPRAFDVLLTLVEHPGRLVTKALLLERVWPKLVVDENNLAVQIASLRRALGAGAIRTVAGYGYRLELPVSATDVEAVTPAAAPVQPVRLSMLQPIWSQRLGPLIARDAEMDELIAAIRGSSLTTIIGVPGAGKTRIAREIASSASQRLGLEAAWVSLQAIDDLQLVPSAIALALGLPLPQGVDGFTALQRLLEQVPVLLVIDNAEHLGELLAAPLAEFLLRTQGPRLLVTSQAPLDVPGETVYRLPALPVPADAVERGEALGFGAVALFVQQATAADQRFALTEANTSQVVEICRQLDGNPLAIELAAARVPALGVGNLLARLDDRFQLLKTARRNTDPRHGTLHAAFDWSYGLLSAAEQRTFDRLGAFAGSFTLQAAAQCVAGDGVDASEATDLICRLVDRSLVAALGTDPPRYRLPETARHYARERLRANGTMEAAGRAMTTTMLALLDAAFQEYWVLDEVVWLARYGPELDNLRAAMDWSADHDATLGVALYGSSWPLFVEADLHAEARRRFHRMVALLSDGLPRDRVGRFWNAVATYDSTRQWDRARYAAELSARMHADTGNVRAHYYALTLLALNWRGDDAAARAAFDAARRVEDSTWQPRLLAQGALVEGALLTSRGEFAAARMAHTRAMRLALNTGERQALSATVNIVELDIASGDLAAALQLARPLALGLRHSGRLETRFELLTLLFAALLLSDALDEARGIGAELHELALRLDTSKLYLALDAMALLACLDGRHAEAARILACSDQVHAVRGQARRRPVEECVQAAATARIEAAGLRCRQHMSAERDPLDEAAACALALGREV